MGMLARRRFKMYYRLNAECCYQLAYPEGVSYDDARMALLLAIKMIYQIPSKTVEVIDAKDWGDM